MKKPAFLQSVPSAAVLLARIYANRVVLICCLLLFLPIVGTLGYMIVEGWSFFDSLYMAVITMTTIGYGEVNPLSTEGRVFTIIFVFFGVGTVFYSLTVLIETFIHSETVNNSFIVRLIRSMDNHYIVCGYGRTGSRIVQELQALKKHFLVIDINGECIEDLRKAGIPVIRGDASHEDVLARAGIHKATGLVSALDSDAANVFVVLSARELNSTLHIVARAETLSAQSKLKRAGANAVLSPHEIGATRLTHMLLQRSVLDSFELVTNRITLDVSIEEFEMESEHRMCDKTLADLDFRGKFNAIVLAIKYPDEHIEFPPNPQSVLHQGTSLIVAATGDQLEKIHAYFNTQYMRRS